MLIFARFWKDVLIAIFGSVGVAEDRRNVQAENAGIRSQNIDSLTFFLSVRHFLDRLDYRIAETLLPVTGLRNSRHHR